MLKKKKVIKINQSSIKRLDLDVLESIQKVLIGEHNTVGLSKKLGYDKFS